MNAERRKRIEAASAKIREAIGELESVRDDQQEAFDAMPGSFQQGERGEKSQSAIDAIESAIGDCENAESSLEESTQ